jgi:hypothetical protein
MRSKTEESVLKNVLDKSLDPITNGFGSSLIKRINDDFGTLIDALHQVPHATLVIGNSLSMKLSHAIFSQDVGATYSSNLD